MFKFNIQSVMIRLREVLKSARNDIAVATKIYFEPLRAIYHWLKRQIFRRRTRFQMRIEAHYALREALMRFSSIVLTMSTPEGRRLLRHQSNTMLRLLRIMGGIKPFRKSDRLFEQFIRFAMELSPQVRYDFFYTFLRHGDLDSLATAK